ncbi:MAG: hypothetical protein FWC40_02925 [Proteobacteria bacterium]|nr:hypothetical protein [Pseudomonadota bacterium]
MRAFVLLASAQNPEEQLYVSRDGGSFAEDEETRIANDFDLIGVEAAVQLKASGALDEVVVFGMAPDEVQIRKALAMGADRGILAAVSNAALVPERVVATALAAMGETRDTVVFCGKMCVNFESGQVAQRLSVAMGCPCVCQAFEIARDRSGWRVLCEEDGGVPAFLLEAPFVVSVDLRLATPRFPSFPSILRARIKPVDVISPAMATPLRTVSIVPDENARRQCVMMEEGSFLAQLGGALRG